MARCQDPGGVPQGAQMHAAAGKLQVHFGLQPIGQIVAALRGLHSERAVGAIVILVHAEDDTSGVDDWRAKRAGSPDQPVIVDRPPYSKRREIAPQTLVEYVIVYTRVGMQHASRSDPLSEAGYPVRSVEIQGRRDVEIPPLA